MVLAIILWRKRWCSTLYLFKSLSKPLGKKSKILSRQPPHWAATSQIPRILTFSPPWQKRIRRVGYFIAGYGQMDSPGPAGKEGIIHITALLSLLKIFRYYNYVQALLMIITKKNTHTHTHLIEMHWGKDPSFVGHLLN